MTTVAKFSPHITNLFRDPNHSIVHVLWTSISTGSIQLSIVVINAGLDFSKTNCSRSIANPLSNDCMAVMNTLTSGLAQRRLNTFTPLIYEAWTKASRQLYTIH